MIPAHLFDSSRYFFNPHAIPLFISVALIALMGAKAIATSRSKTNLYYGAVCLSIMVWLFFTAIGYLVRDDEILAAFWFRLDWLGVSYISINVYAFVVHFLDKKRPLAINIGYGIATFFAVWTLVTNPMMTGVKKFSWGFFAQREYRLSFFFFLFFFGCMVASFSELIAAYRETPDPVRRNHIKYVLLAYGVAYIASMDFLPTYGIAVYPFGFIFISLYVAITAYAILRHHLMDINIVVRKTLLYSVVTAGLASLYAGAVTLLARILEHPALSRNVFSLGIFTSFMNNPKLFGYVTFLGFTGLINFLTSTALAVLVYRKCPRRDVGIAYALLNLSIACHSAFYFLWQCASTSSGGLLDLRILTFFGMWINPALLYFNGTFLGWNGYRRKSLWIAGLGTIFFSILNFTDAMYWSVISRDALGYWPVAVTGWFAAYLVFWHGELLFAFGDLIYNRQHLEGHTRDQVTYMIAAFAIGYAGGITNWPMWFNIRIPPYPNFLISVYTFMVAYAMVKHHLMDITIVIRKTLLYSLVSAALASVYVGTITLLAQGLGSRHGSASVVSSALAAIFITLLFNPLRIKTQRWIDRHFPREHLDPELLQEAAGQFAHEMKRPLAKISMPAQLALMELESVKSGEKTWKEVLPAMEKKLQYIVSQSMDAGNMIEAIRELFTTSVPFETVDLRQVVEEAVAANKDLLDKQSIAVSLQLSADLPEISGRPKQLEIVFVNLLKNAVEAMNDVPAGRKREIHVDGEANQAHVTIRVSDTGPGIKPDDVGKIFHAGHSTKGQKGTGLGLYLSFQIIQSHNATIEVSSREGRGTTFTIRFPRNSSKTH